MTRESAVPAPPLQRLYDLRDLSDAGAEIAIAAPPDDLPRLAEWFDVERVTRFEATVTLTRKSMGHFQYEAELTADLVQACVVSLEPVPSHHQLHVSRALHLKPRGRRQRPDDVEGGVVILSAGDEDGPEELDNPHYDLVMPLLEDLSLDIDLYPRANGVEFELPGEHGKEDESPFAALKRLKEGGS